jgi:hypothetical protein
MATKRAVFKIRHFPFSIINFPFAPPGRFGGIENGRWKMENYGNKTRCSADTRVWPSSLISLIPVNRAQPGR